MNDSVKKMCDSIKSSKSSFFSELEGAENTNINSSWTRRLVSPWGLLFPVEGTGSISLDEEVVTASKGTLFVYQPGYRYTFRSCGKWRYLWFHFPIRDHILGQMDFDEVIPGLGMWNPDQKIWERILVELREAISLEEIHQPGWDALALLLVETVLQRFACRRQPGTKRTHGRIRHIIQLLTGERNYRIGEIAAECGMSVPLLFQIFRKEMGCSPRKYREQFFLRQGKKMLLNTDLSLENIAVDCHMCDRYYFSNRFKRLFGISPAAFRKAACQST
ncbi:MAG: helix-turn-helix transcriptional regulator [Victivallales bacterium]|nr:helix-turn-helix transcriptional regulator [Victivallales bacterium]